MILKSIFIVIQMEGKKKWRTTNGGKKKKRISKIGKEILLLSCEMQKFQQEKPTLGLDPPYPR